MSLAPLTPEDCDLRGYEWMPLFGGRLFASQFEAHACDLAFRVAIKLYWECWQQVPAASLPNDDVQLCRLAGLGRDMKTWRKLRADGVLHGFRLCSDDRLYHGMLAEEAIKAWASRQQAQHERDLTRERTRRWRDRTPNTPEKPVTRHNGSGDASRDGDKPPGDASRDGGVTRLVTVARDKGQGSTVQEKEEILNLTSFIPPNSARDAAEWQELEEPEPTEVEVMEQRQAFATELERSAPDIAAHVRRAANASRMRATFSEGRSPDAQRDALAAQPAAVGADVALGLRWQPAEPVRSVEEQMRALLADCTPEQIARAKRYARA